MLQTKINFAPSIQEEIQSLTEGYSKYYKGIKYGLEPGCLTMTYEDGDGVAADVKRALATMPDVTKEMETKKMRYPAKRNRISKETIPETKNLPIKMTDEMSSFTHYSLIVPILLTDKNLEEWYYNAFVNLVGISQFYNYTDYEFRFYYKFFKFNKYTYDCLTGKKGVAEEIIQGIGQDFYTNIWVDHFYLEGFSAYDKYHFVHPVTIYGYDKGSGCFDCLCFDVKKKVFQAKIRFDKIELAFERGKVFWQKGFTGIDEGPFEMLKLRDFNEYRFDIKYFIKELGNYIESKSDRNHYYFIFGGAVDRNQMVFGLENYDLFIDVLTEKQPGDFRLIYLLSEHKHLLYKRLQFVMDKYKIDNRTTGYVDSYAEICTGIDAIKNTYMKSSLRQSGGREFYKPPKDEKVRESMLTAVRELREKEKNLLDKIYKELHKMFIFNSDCIRRPDISANAMKTRTENSVRLDWNKPVDISRVELYSPLLDENTPGSIRMSDGSVYRSGEKTEAIKNVKWLEFRPDDPAALEQLEIMAYPLNLALGQAVSGSSHLHLPDVLNCAPENVLTNDDDQFWCPNTDRPGSYLEISFDKPTLLNAANIRQFYIFPRIDEFELSYYDGHEWNLLYKKEGYAKVIVDIARFPEIKAEKVRLTVTKTVEYLDSLAPNISGFEVYYIPNEGKGELPCLT